MRILRDISGLISQSGPVIALGNFDGVHLGHRHIIEKAKHIADKMHAPCAVMTFEPHPRRFFRPDLPDFAITPFREKAGLLAELGVDLLFAMRFNQTFSQLSAERFTREVLAGGIRARHIVTGPGFTFGHQRGGNPALLTALGSELGFGYSEVPALEIDGTPCSSTRIRAALAAGDMQLANRLLGRNYAVCGHVIHGEKRGRVLGFPTANLALRRRCLPATGIYAVTLTAGADSYPGAASFGSRPTFNGEALLLEVHCLDASPDLYGRRVKVEFIARLRDEWKFEGVDALKAQIEKDIVQARAILC